LIGACKAESAVGWLSAVRQRGKRPVPMHVRRQLPRGGIWQEGKARKRDSGTRRKTGDSDARSASADLPSGLGSISDRDCRADPRV